MNTTIPGTRMSRALSAFSVSALMLLAGTAVLAQQPSSSSTEAQREAMRKLSFLAGQWSGPATISHGPGEPLHLTQTEDVEYKLDGLVLLVQGKSTGADRKAQFEALATIAYDDASHSYHIRAYSGGHYLDAPLTVSNEGFSWGFDAGPAHIMNTMHLTAKGEWQETTEVTMGNAPPRHTVELLLRRQP